MAQAATKVPVKSEAALAPRSARWPFESLHQEIERVFDDFQHGLWRTPRLSALDLWPQMPAAVMPSVDIAEQDKAYQVTAELPGMTEKDIQVQVSDSMLTIKGEKQQEREKKEKGYYLSEREFGAFQRSFPLPRGIDADKIEAALKDGILTITLPKTAEAQKKEKSIPVQKA